MQLNAEQLKLLDPVFDEFIKDFHQWIEEGLPQNEIVSKHCGICDNFTIFCAEHYSDVTQHICTHYLTKKFQKQGLNGYFPFNEGKAKLYLGECTSHSLYDNQQRLSWVAKEVDRIKKEMGL